MSRAPWLFVLLALLVSGGALGQPTAQARQNDAREQAVEVAAQGFLRACVTALSARMVERPGGLEPDWEGGSCEDARLNLAPLPAEISAGWTSRVTLHPEAEEGFAVSVTSRQGREYRWPTTFTLLPTQADEIRQSVVADVPTWLARLAAGGVALFVAWGAVFWPWLRWLAWLGWGLSLWEVTVAGWWISALASGRGPDVYVPLDALLWLAGGLALTAAVLTWARRWSVAGRESAAASLGAALLALHACGLSGWWITSWTSQSSAFWAGFVALGAGSAVLWLLAWRRSCTAFTPRGAQSRT